MNGNTIELDQLIYDLNPANIGSMNDHPLIEEQTKKVASSCNHDNVRYAPINLGQGDNFQEDDMGIELNEVPETYQPQSIKECFSSFHFHRNKCH